MIEWTTAWQKANEHLAAKELFDPEDAAMVVESSTAEYDFGWVFSYDSRKYLETGDKGARLVGNVPFIVDRRDGSIHENPTNFAPALVEYSQRYQAEIAVGWVDSPAPPQ